MPASLSLDTLMWVKWDHEWSSYGDRDGGYAWVLQHHFFSPRLIWLLLLLMSNPSAIKPNTQTPKEANKPPIDMWAIIGSFHPGNGSNSSCLGLTHILGVAVCPFLPGAPPPAP